MTAENSNPNVLTEEEKGNLVELGRSIQLSLECDVNETGLPCRSDRLAGVDFMIQYLEVHGYTVKS